MDRATYKTLLFKARVWWTTLSIKEGKILCAKSGAVVINGWPLSTWLIEMYLANNPTA